MTSSIITNTQAVDGIEANIGAPIKYLPTDREWTIAQPETNGTIMRYNDIIVVDPNQTANGTFSDINYDFLRHGVVVFAGGATSANAVLPSTIQVLNTLIRTRFYHIQRTQHQLTDFGFYPSNFLSMAKQWLEVIFVNTTGNSISLSGATTWNFQGSVNIQADSYAVYYVIIERTRTPTLNPNFRLIRVS